MKLQLLPTTIDEKGRATAQQHLCCLVVDDCVAVDAGSLAMSTNQTQKEQIRDVVLTHAHLDHIAGLPIFIDDLFAMLKTPVRIHALPEVITALEEFIFNWTIYPRFTELKNNFGEVMSYFPFEPEQNFEVAHLKFKAIEVNHKVPTVGFIFSDQKSKVAVSSDTAEMDRFWEVLNAEKDLNGLLIECAFPNELSELAQASHHLTPEGLKKEIAKFKHSDCPIFVINIKPTYQKQILKELKDLKIKKLEIFEVGKVYQF
jgi:cAMP phosphodiesterase